MARAHFGWGHRCGCKSLFNMSYRIYGDRRQHINRSKKNDWEDFHLKQWIKSNSNWNYANLLRYFLMLAIVATNEMCCHLLIYKFNGCPLVNFLSFILNIFNADQIKCVNCWFSLSHWIKKFKLMKSVSFLCISKDNKKFRIRTSNAVAMRVSTKYVYNAIVTIGHNWSVSFAHPLVISFSSIAFIQWSRIFIDFNSRKHIGWTPHGRVDCMWDVAFLLYTCCGRRRWIEGNIYKKRKKKNCITYWIWSKEIKFTHLLHTDIVHSFNGAIQYEKLKCKMHCSALYKRV